MFPLGKKLDSKIKKHQEIVTLAIAKRDTVYRLHSKALADNKISDSEFQLIMAEFQQYNMLKEAVRAKLTRNSSQPDTEKIKKRFTKRDRDRISKKKINALTAGLNKLLKIHGIICISLKLWRVFRVKIKN